MAEWAKYLPEETHVIYYATQGLPSLAAEHTENIMYNINIHRINKYIKLIYYFTSSSSYHVNVLWLGKSKFSSIDCPGKKEDSIFSHSRLPEGDSTCSTPDHTLNTLLTISSPGPLITELKTGLWKQKKRHQRTISNTHMHCIKTFMHMYTYSQHK